MPLRRPPKKPIPDKVCKRPECKTIFSPYREWQEYCSPRCRGLHYWETHETIRTDQGEQIVPINPENVTAGATTSTDTNQPVA